MQACRFISKPKVSLSVTHPLQAKAAERQAALLGSALDQQAKTCTFRPQTNHQRRQEQLRRLLAEPSGELSPLWAG
jgi:hypothetical protein